MQSYLPLSSDASSTGDDDDGDDDDDDGDPDGPGGPVGQVCFHGPISSILTDATSVAVLLFLNRIDGTYVKNSETLGNYVLSKCLVDGSYRYR